MLMKRMNLFFTSTLLNCSRDGFLNVFRTLAYRTLLVGLFACVSATVMARELPFHEITATEVDYALRDSLLSGDMNSFKNYLLSGADPTEWLDDSQHGWTFCAATEAGREIYLRLLIDEGYDVNFRQVDISSSISLPLTCAVRFRNLDALKILIAAGADPTVPPSIKFPDRIPMSVMSEAIIIGKYELAVWLFDKGNYSDVQLRSDIGMLERHIVDEAAPGNHYRLKLAELFRQKGYKVNLWTKDKNTGN